MTTDTPPAGGPILPAWLAGLGLRAADLAAFAGDLSVRRGALLARHRDARRRELGVERVWRGPEGLRYAYTRGARRGVVLGLRTAAPRRLLVADGALPALCAAAWDGLRADTAYLGLPGAWSATAADAAAAQVLDGADEVVLALADTETGRRSVAAAVADLRPLRSQVARLVRRTPPDGGWPAALLAVRQGGPPDARDAA